MRRDGSIGPPRSGDKADCGGYAPAVPARKFAGPGARATLWMRIISVWLLLIAPLAGCGYSDSSLYPRDIRTVAVPIWRSDTFRRQIEFRLTEAIDKNIEARTPYRLASVKHADSVLTGRVVAVQESVLSSSFQTNLPQETQVTIVVDFTWKDLRTQKILVRRKSFARASTEIPQIGQQLPDAEQMAIERLARAIVNQMQEGW